MTGKEEYYKGTTCVKRGSKECVDALWRLALKDCAKEYWLGVRRMAEQVLDDLDELAKYKGAFEILKDRLKIGVCLQDDYPDGYTLYGGGTKNINKEEYELLEELMKDEI